MKKVLKSGALYSNPNIFFQHPGPMRHGDPSEQMGGQAPGPVMAPMMGGPKEGGQGPGPLQGQQGQFNSEEDDDDDESGSDESDDDDDDDDDEDDDHVALEGYLSFPT